MQIMNLRLQSYRSWRVSGMDLSVGLCFDRRAHTIISALVSMNPRYCLSPQ